MHLLNLQRIVQWITQCIAQRIVQWIVQRKPIPQQNDEYNPLDNPLKIFYNPQRMTNP
eukprot:TRINITY_DN15413_c0_g1_i1.p1 TRINITY_DN15413_c0_g1~~TRINITY_DN15413_c0_g1_i1.p1  ORF type:complete len:58 (+),score=5.80 TRINITY_DN15413_c0_g1_i1:141-314(+)